MSIETSVMGRIKSGFGTRRSAGAGSCLVKSSRSCISSADQLKSSTFCNTVELVETGVAGISNAGRTGRVDSFWSGDFACWLPSIFRNRADVDCAIPRLENPNAKIAKREAAKTNWRQKFIVGLSASEAAGRKRGMSIARTCWDGSSEALTQGRQIRTRCSTPQNHYRRNNSKPLSNMRSPGLAWRNRVPCQAVNVCPKVVTLRFNQCSGKTKPFWVC